LLNNIPLDMVAYLVVVQVVPLVGLMDEAQDNSELYRFVVICQSALIVLFLLVWGGYGKDSWEYLPGFDGNPFTWEKEWLFWIFGYVLNKLIHDPWPLKLISALGGGILCYAIVAFLRPSGWRYCVLGLFALLLMPGFYLLLGSAVRQGLAGALVILGLIALYHERYRTFAGVVVLAFFFHQASVLLAVAGVLSRLWSRGAPYALVAAPILGFLALWVGTVYIEVGNYVPHTDKQEGMFYWEKFVVAYVLAFGAIYLARDADIPHRQIVAAYGYMVAASAFFVKYEVPFERLLGYSELLLPFVEAIAVSALTWHRWRLAGLWLAGLAAGVWLWSHPSIVETLGYGTA